MNDMYLVMHASEATVPSKKLTHQETVSYDNISNYDISIQIVCQLVHSMDMMWKAPQRFLCNILILESNNQVSHRSCYELPTCCFVAHLGLWNLIASIWEDQVHFIGRELLNCYVTFSSYMCQKLRPKSYKLGTTKT